MTDVLIIGAGLAGIAMAETLERGGKSFVVLDDGSQRSSTVAGGVYNPVILKRLTKAWKAGEQLEEAEPFYQELERRFQRPLDHKTPVMRRLSSVEEQNNWFAACDRPDLAPFLSDQLHREAVPGVDAAYGFGRVKGTGRVDTGLLLKCYHEALLTSGKMRRVHFDYTKLALIEDGVQYEDIKARKVVFCEGFGLRNNPYFRYLPLNGTKGELLLIKAPGLSLDFILKSSVFLIPMGGDLFKVGATYAWQDKTQEPTSEARTEMLNNLRSFFHGDFEVVDQLAGIRPTVADRRPLLGEHPEYRQLLVLNGLGSRGVMIAPYAARRLYQFMYEDQALETDMDISRFGKRYVKYKKEGGLIS